MGLTHFDEAPSRQFEIGHLRGRWTGLGEAAGCVDVGVRRLEIPAGGWSTPAHEHGREEEIFYVLAFGPRHYDESVWFPRLSLAFAGRGAVEAADRSPGGVPIQFAREAELGPPELPDDSGPPEPRPPTIVNVRDVPAEPLERPRVVRVRRNLGRAAGSVTTGLQHAEVAPGKENTAQHCHSLEEEIFVILEGDGVLMLGEEETPVAPGNVISRPAGTGVAHMLRAGESGLKYLAYGTRDPGDVCYYPRSNKVSFRGVGVIARLERLEYWDGED